MNNKPELIKSQAYINGQWVDASEGKTFEVVNPSNGETLEKVADLSREDVAKAIEAAHKAFPEWKAKSAEERSDLLMKWHDLMLEHLEELGEIMTLEQGKPKEEAKGEVKYGAGFIKWFAEEGKRLYGDVIPSPDTSKRTIVIKQPVGVAAAITPWNFPNAMITRKAGPALAAGCTFVVKPASSTPLSALALAELAHKAGIPKGVFNVITSSDSKEVGKELTTSELVDKITFTGSTKIGKILMEQSASTVKKISLELGGNAPFLVFDDADLDKAVEGAIACKFRNAGQTCVCANRILVQQGVYDAFAEKFTKAVKELKVGDGLEEGVKIGPLINQEQFEKVEAFVKDATEKGGKITTGGGQHQKGGSFFEPTVITEATTEMEFTQKEIFGPVAPLYRFKSDEEGIQMANDTIYGLASYFYARDISRVWKASEELQYGIVGANTGLISTPSAPFGGVKQSGLGREGSKYGIEEYIEIKYISMKVD